MFVGQIKLKTCVLGWCALVSLLAANSSAVGQSDLEIVLSEFEMSYLGQNQAQAVVAAGDAGGSGGTISDSTSAPIGGNLDIAESDRLLVSTFTNNGSSGDLITDASLRLWGDLLIENVGGSIPIGVLFDLTPAFDSVVDPFGFDLFTDDLNVVGDVGLPLLRLEFTAGELLLQDTSVKLTARAMVLQENLPLSLTFGGVGSKVLFEYTALLPGFSGQNTADSFASPQGVIRISAIPEPASLALLIASMVVGCLVTARNQMPQAIGYRR